MWHKPTVFDVKVENSFNILAKGDRPIHIRAESFYTKSPVGLCTSNKILLEKFSKKGSLMLKTGHCLGITYTS